MRPIYIDTETTGLRSDRDRIIELACYDPVEDRTLSRLINPNCPIPAEATAIHQITDQMVADAPPFAIVGQEMIDFLQGEVVLVAHNGDSFDIPFLQAEFKRANLPWPKCMTFDSLKWARRYRRDLPRHSLQFLTQTYNIEVKTAHRALADVISLHALMTHMIDDLPWSTVHALAQKK